MIQSRSLSEFRCLSENTRVYPIYIVCTGFYHRDDNGRTYSGPVAYTMSGKRCGLWKDNGYDIDGNMCILIYCLYRMLS